jgi:hypothetical protein
MQGQSKAAKQRRRVRKELTRDVVVELEDGGKRNEYLQTLLDPEKFNGVRYPDKYDKKTAMVSTIINVDQPFISAGSASGENPGDFLTIVSPTLVHPALAYVDEVSSGSIGYSMITVEQSQLTGIYPLSPVPSVSASTGIMHVPGSPVGSPQYQNIRGMCSWSDQLFGLPTFSALDPTGNVFYGFPTYVPGAAGSISITFASAPPAGTSVSIQWVREDAVGTAATILTTPGIQAYNGVALSLPPGFSKLPGLGLRIAASVDVAISWIVFRTGVTASGQAFARFQPLDWPDVDTFLETVDRYRTVSMSVWEEYQGSDLNNGGMIASLSFGGGVSPFDNGLFSYSGVAETPGSYSGALKTGTYGIWVPVNDYDMLFRRLDDRSRWQLPYLVIAGNTATPTQLKSIRLRIVANHELISTSQFYNYDFSPNNVLLIEHAARSLRNFQLTMENPSHVQAIRDLLKKATDVGSKVASWISENKQWLMPAASAALALL